MTVGKVFENGIRWFLLAILILVASSALIRWVALPQPSWVQLSEKQARFNAAQDAKFQSLFDQGIKARNDRRYPEALAQFQEAERSVAHLNDAQYSGLNKARLSIASAYEESGDASGAEAVYKSLADSSLRDGAAYLHSRDEVALVRYQDAEAFTQHLTDDRDRYVLMSTYAEAECLRDMRRLPEALAATQRAIDYLQTTASEYDPRTVDQYKELARTYQLEEDWPHLEETITTTVALCDKILAHWSGMTGNDNPTSNLQFSKNQLLFALMDAYDHDGKPDLALSTGEDLYNLVSQTPTYAMPGPHNRRDIADFALRIALKANKQDAADTWRKRS